MIRKSLIVFVIIFAAFNIYLKVTGSEPREYQNLFQQNVMKAQSYMYRDDAPSAVILGTSLSAYLPLPDSVFNLSMSGLNVMDGINVMERTNMVPPTVFIETNFFFRKENPTFTGIFDSEFMNHMRSGLPGMREANQPVNLVLSYIKPADKPMKSRPVPQKTVIAPDVIANLLAEQEERYKIVDTQLIYRGLDRLEKFVGQVTAAGGKVCFFEMPVERTLARLPLANAVRENILTKFSRVRNVFFLPLPEGMELRTKDGLHLDDVGVWDYTVYFKQGTANLLKGIASN